MLFLVITTPRLDPPSDVTSRRQDYWKWVDSIRKSKPKEVLGVYARVGRGGAALFDVDSTFKLHRYLGEWSEYMPVHFEIYPLLDSKQALGYMKDHARRHAKTGSATAIPQKKKRRARN